MKAAKAGQGPLRKQVQELTHSLGDVEAAARAAQDQARRDAEEIEALRKQVADRDQRLRASADAQARMHDLEDQNKEDKESIMSIRRERDRLLALLEQTEARISELESASKREKTDNASLCKQVLCGVRYVTGTHTLTTFSPPALCVVPGARAVRGPRPLRHR